MAEEKHNPIVEHELEVLASWNDHKIFEKSLEATKNGPRYSFYDGPPFATGTPHYGHLVGNLMKDVVPRYWTMKGHYVERRWGWDCHGLPIENIVEKELGFKSKKDIEAIGIEKFNDLCRSKVLGYVEEWKKTINRFGRWADMENSYKTMDLDYMESVWWVFKELWDKGLVYEGYKSMHVCPRCETTLSQQEVSEGYRDIKDLSVIAKFELVDLPPHLASPQAGEEKTYILAWTTTPWTLPANVSLAVGEDVDYVQLKITNDELRIGENYIIAKERVADVFKDNKFEIIREFKGSELIGKKYLPLFPYYGVETGHAPSLHGENLYSIVSADFVTTEDGTGVVHIAPAFGEDDMQLGKEKNLPFIQNVTMSGHFTDEVEDFKGLNVKPVDDTQATDVKIIKYLAGKGLLFAKEKYEHSYPHCWRCETPLINYATSSWFVKVTGVKERALELAKEINWSPAHIKEGRFGNWLEGARDWSISRQRFWASCMPIWKCECGEMIVFGNIKDLEEASGEKIIDLHKDKVDKIEVPCPKCDQKMHRIPDVLDCWFESGSMPYAQEHYPFENKDKFEQKFPAQFIAEGPDQTRAWFYYLHIISTAIKDSVAFKNAIVNGIVLAEDGKKMAKKLNNYPEPELIMNKYGADAMRYYLLSSPVMATENLNFSEAGVREAMQKIVMLLNNILNFYKLYEDALPPLNPPLVKGGNKEGEVKGVGAGNPLLSTRATPEASARREEGQGVVGRGNILDQWLIAKLHTLIKEVTHQMDNYDLNRSVRPIGEFIDQLSTWWLRRSRDRFKSEDEKDKKQALSTFKYVLAELVKVMAPFTPFVADYVYKQIGGEKESVHLEKWPLAQEQLIDQNLLEQMDEVKRLVEAGLSARAENNIKIRQPLASFKYSDSEFKIPNNKKWHVLIEDEVNVKDVILVKNLGKEVELDIEITDELKVDGMVRELTRSINDIRKKQGLTIGDKVKVLWSSDGEVVNKVFADIKFVDELMKSTLTEEFTPQKNAGAAIKVNEENITLEVIKL